MVYQLPKNQEAVVVVCHQDKLQLKQTLHQEEDQANQLLLLLNSDKTKILE
jgi:hypothetical protein